MLTPRKLIALLTLILVFFSPFGFAVASDLGPGWVESTSVDGITIYIPTGDNTEGTIGTGIPVLTEDNKEYYSPIAGTPDTLKVDSSGRIGRVLDEVTRISRADGSMYVYSTKVTLYTEDAAVSNAMWDIVRSDPASFPSLSASLTSSLVPPPPSPGIVVKIGGSKYLLGAYVGTGHAVSPSTGTYIYSSYGFAYYGTGRNYEWNDYNYVKYYAYSTTQDESPLAINYSTLATSVAASGAAAESEIDKLIFENPDAFKKSYTSSATQGLDDPPVPTPLTDEVLDKIYIVNGAPEGAGSPVIDPVTGSLTLPDNVDISTGDNSDIYGPGYTPGYNNSPYGTDSDIPGGVDFGLRTSKFMTDLRGSSLFSLPTSILGNIPTSGTSAISFDGGQFGQQSLDFAAFSNQLMIIRSVLLLCFSLLSIRIVTLKR
jgi:hypothetical protein